MYQSGRNNLERGSAQWVSALDVVLSRGWFAERMPVVQSRLAAIMVLRDLESGQTLFRYGDPPNGVFGLVKGAFEVSLPRADGAAYPGFIGRPGHWIGGPTAVSERPRYASVTVSGPTRLFHIPNHALHVLLQNETYLYADFHDLAVANLERVLAILATLSTSPSLQRVAARLVLQNSLLSDGSNELRISHAKLAEMTALSGPTLQRALRQLEERGIIARGYGRIRILDPERLEATCRPATDAEADEPDSPPYQEEPRRRRSA